MVIQAAFSVGMEGSLTASINFATETSLSVEEVTAALETVTMESGETFASIAFSGEIETVMRMAELCPVSFASSVSADLFADVGTLVQTAWTTAFPGT